MNRKGWVLGLVLFSLVTFSSNAYPWAYSTHAYIADNLGKKHRDGNLNEIYGALAPDMFNFSFTLPVYVPGGIYEQFHYGFMNLWNGTEEDEERELAYGFITHNDQWGGDFTAHHDGLTYGQGEGYVIAKALLMWEVSPDLVALVDNPDVAMELYHEFVELGLEVLTTRIDPEIGQKISNAAILRDDDFPGLLSNTFANGFAPLFNGSIEAAVQVIHLGEEEFRNSMVSFGQILMLEEEDMIHALAMATAASADSYLALNGITLPEGFDIVEAIKGYINLSIQICDYDYPTEIEATLHYLKKQMKREGIRYKIRRESEEKHEHVKRRDR